MLRSLTRVLPMNMFDVLGRCRNRGAVVKKRSGVSMVAVTTPLFWWLGGRLLMVLNYRAW